MSSSSRDGSCSQGKHQVIGLYLAQSFDVVDLDRSDHHVGQRSVPQIDFGNCIRFIGGKRSPNKSRDARVEGDSLLQ